MANGGTDRKGRPYVVQFVDELLDPNFKDFPKSQISAILRTLTAILEGEAANFPHAREELKKRFGWSWEQVLENHRTEVREFQAGPPQVPAPTPTATPAPTPAPTPEPKTPLPPLFPTLIGERPDMAAPGPDTATNLRPTWESDVDLEAEIQELLDADKTQLGGLSVAGRARLNALLIERDERASRAAEDRPTAVISRSEAIKSAVENAFNSVSQTEIEAIQARGASLDEFNRFMDLINQNLVGVLGDDTRPTNAQEVQNVLGDVETYDSSTPPTAAQAFAVYRAATAQESGAAEGESQLPLIEQLEARVREMPTFVPDRPILLDQIRVIRQQIEAGSNFVVDAERNQIPIQSALANLESQIATAELTVSDAEAASEYIDKIPIVDPATNVVTGHRIVRRSTADGRILEELHIEESPSGSAAADLAKIERERADEAAHQEMLRHAEVTIRAIVDDLRLLNFTMSPERAAKTIAPIARNAGISDRTEMAILIAAAGHDPSNEALMDRAMYLLNLGAPTALTAGAGGGITQAVVEAQLNGEQPPGAAAFGGGATNWATGGGPAGAAVIPGATPLETGTSVDLLRIGNATAALVGSGFMSYDDAFLMLDASVKVGLSLLGPNGFINLDIDPNELIERLAHASSRGEMSITDAVNEINGIVDRANEARVQELEIERMTENRAIAIANLRNQSAQFNFSVEQAERSRQSDIDRQFTDLDVREQNEINNWMQTLVGLAQSGGLPGPQRGVPADLAAATDLARRAGASPPAPIEVGGLLDVPDFGAQFDAARARLEAQRAERPFDSARLLAETEIPELAEVGT